MAQPPEYIIDSICRGSPPLLVIDSTDRFYQAYLSKQLISGKAVCPRQKRYHIQTQKVIDL